MLALSFMATCGRCSGRRMVRGMSAAPSQPIEADAYALQTHPSRLMLGVIEIVPREGTSLGCYRLKICVFRICVSTILFNGRSGQLFQGIVTIMHAEASSSSSANLAVVKHEDNDEPRVCSCLAAPRPGVESVFYRCLAYLFDENASQL